MSNSILDNYELGVLTELSAYLREKGRNGIADRLDRSLHYARIGALSRDAFLNGVCREAAFRGIFLACRDKDSALITNIVAVCFHYE